MAGSQSLETDRVLYLSRLFDTLPSSLPLDSEFAVFGLDSDEVDDIGHVGALNQCFHRVWGYKNDGLIIDCRGVKLDCTIAVLKSISSLMEGDIIFNSWVDALIEASLVAGASEMKAAAQRKSVVESDFSDSGSECSVVVSESPKHSRTVPPVKKLRQTQLQFKKLTPEEAAEQRRRISEIANASFAQKQAAREVQKEKEKERKKTYERERKSWWRWRKRQRQASNSMAKLSDSDPVLEDLIPASESDNDSIKTHTDSRNTDPQSDGPSQNPSTLPSVSHRDTSLSLKQQNARLTLSKKTLMRRERKAQKTGMPPPAHRMNWQQHWTWVDILDAQKAVGWSATDIARYLHLKKPEWYKPQSGDTGGLHKGTIAKWIEDDGHGGRQWKASVLQRAEVGRKGITRRSKILAPYPHIVKAINAQLEVTRKLGGAVQRPLAMAIMRAHIQHGAPHLFVEKNFHLSASWAHYYVVNELDWVQRAATQKAHKLPKNYSILTRNMHARITMVCRLYNIHPDFVVNADQAGIVIFPTGKYTYEKKGSKDVAVAGHDEKRQTTVVTASSMSGNILPFQSIWGGSTDSSLPSKQAPRRSEADERGFTYGHGDKRHWSSKDTTKQWVLTTLDPYLERMQAKHHLPPESKSVFLIDVWPVHIAKKSPDDFLPWMRLTHPNIIVLFVPGGCTGIAQPADVGLQRLLKHHVKKSASDFVMAVATAQLARGVLPHDIILPMDLPTLRNASIAWLVDAFDFFAQNPDVVRKAWAMCKIDTPAHGMLDLSYNSITSSNALDHCQDAIASDPALQQEMAKFSFSTISGELEAEESLNFHAGMDDDVGLSISDVAQHWIQNPHTEAVLLDPLTETDFERFEMPARFHPSGCPPPSHVADSSLSDAIASAGNTVAAPPVDPASTFRLDIAVQGGTNYAAFMTNEEARVTDRTSRPKKKASAPVDEPGSSQAAESTGGGAVPTRKRGRRARTVAGSTDLASSEVRSKRIKSG